MSEECEALKCLKQAHQMKVARLSCIQKETELLLAEILKYHLTNCIQGTVNASTDEEREAFRLLGWRTELPMSIEGVDDWIKRRRHMLGFNLRGN